MNVLFDYFDGIDHNSYIYWRLFDSVERTQNKSMVLISALSRNYAYVFETAQCQIQYSEGVMESLNVTLDVRNDDDLTLFDWGKK